MEATLWKNSDLNWLEHIYHWKYSIHVVLTPLFQLFTFINHHYHHHHQVIRLKDWNWGLSDNIIKSSPISATLLAQHISVPQYFCMLVLCSYFLVIICFLFPWLCLQVLEITGPRVSYFAQDSLSFSILSNSYRFAPSFRTCSFDLFFFSTSLSASCDNATNLKASNFL